MHERITTPGRVRRHHLIGIDANTRAAIDHHGTSSPERHDQAVESQICRCGRKTIPVIACRIVAIRTFEARAVKELLFVEEKHIRSIDQLVR